MHLQLFNAKTDVKFLNLFGANFHSLKIKLISLIRNKIFYE